MPCFARLRCRHVFCSVAQIRATRAAGIRAKSRKPQSTRTLAASKHKHYGLEEVVTRKIHIITPLVTFDGGFTDLELAVGSLMPNLTYTGLGYVVGVKNLMNGKTYDFNRFRMPDEEISVQIITSTEKPLEEKVLTPGVNKNGAEKLDTSSSTENVVSKIGEDSIFTVNTAFSATLDKRDVDIKGFSDDDLLRGSILNLTGKAGNFTRFLTGVGASGTEAGIEKGKTYIFTYNVENKGKRSRSAVHAVAVHFLRYRKQY